MRPPAGTLPNTMHHVSASEACTTEWIADWKLRRVVGKAHAYTTIQRARAFDLPKTTARSGDPTCTSLSLFERNIPLVSIILSHNSCAQSPLFPDTRETNLHSGQGKHTRSTNFLSAPLTASSASIALLLALRCIQESS